MDYRVGKVVTKHDGQHRGLVGVLSILVVIIIGLVGSIIAINIINQKKQAAFDALEDAVISGDASTDVLSQYIMEVDNKINETENNQEKAALYSERAGYVSVYAEDWEDDKLKEIVLADAYKAEELNPTAETAYSIYFYEREFGNKEKSDYYYNLSTERGMKHEGRG